MRINMQAKPHSPRAEHYPSRRVDYDENATPVDIPGIDHETKEEDSVGKPTAVDKIALATDNINEKVDLDTMSELAPNITNMSICEVDSPTCRKATTDDQTAVPFNPENGQKVPSFIDPTQECSPRINHEEMRTPNSSTLTTSRSGISMCLAEDGEYGIRDISIDEGVPSEDKVLISLDHNIYFEKLSCAMPSATIESSCCSIGLRNKECKPEDQSLSGHDWDRHTQVEPPCSQLNKRNEDANGMLDEAGILNSLKVDEIFPISLKEIDEGNQNEGARSFDECRSGNTTLDKKENIVGCLAKYGDRYDEQWYNLVDYSDGSHDKGVTSNVNWMDGSFEAEGKEKDISYSSQENAEEYLSNKFRTRTNPFADSEEHAHFMSESVSGSLGSHSALSGIFEAEGKIMDRGYLSREDAEPYLSNNFHTRTNPFALSEDEAQFMPESFASLENHSVSNGQFISGLYSTSLGSYSASSADKSSESEGKMSKDRGHSSRENSEVCLSEKFQMRTNPFAILEEEAQFMPVSFESLESHSVSSASLLTGHDVSEHLSDFSSSKSEGMVLKAFDNFQIDPAIVQQVLSEKLLGSEADPKTSVEESYLKKCGNSIDPYTAENFVQIHTSTAAMVDNEGTRNMESQGQKIVGCSTFTGSPSGQVCFLEMRGNVPKQSINEVRYDVSDKVNVNDNASEMSVYTHSGPISISGPISHSGQIPLSGRISYSSGLIPYSGSLSTRSDSSTASTRSFAFPILPNEWNSSPVKMKQADSRYLKKKRRCRFCCFCF